MAKTIGIVGGMTPESTTTYYEHITRTYHERFGNYAFPEIVIFSVSFQKYVDWMQVGQWDTITQGLVKAVRSVKNAGADFAVIATNTMHKVFDQVQARVPLPLLSIIQATAEAIQEENLKTVGLLGTRFTMSKSFYKEGLARAGIQTLVPDIEEQKLVNKVIFEELGIGKINSESKEKFIQIVRRLHNSGAQGVILGCTEIPLLINEKDCGVRLFDTAVLHADQALAFSLSGSDRS